MLTYIPAGEKHVTYLRALITNTFKSDENYCCMVNSCERMNSSSSVKTSLRHRIHRSYEVIGNRNQHELEAYYLYETTLSLITIKITFVCRVHMSVKISPLRYSTHSLSCLQQYSQLVANYNLRTLQPWNETFAVLSLRKGMCTDTSLSNAICHVIM